MVTELKNCIQGDSLSIIMEVFIKRQVLFELCEDVAVINCLSGDVVWLDVFMELVFEKTEDFVFVRNFACVFCV